MRFAKALWTTPATALVTALCALAFALAAIVTPIAEAEVAAQTGFVPGQYIDAKIPATSLQGALLPVPAETTLVVYLPGSYALSDERYPVIYFLHGAGESAKTWSKSISKVMDNLYKSGFDGDFIVAFPSGNNVLGSSFYTNSPVQGNWEDHITKDVVSYVDKAYRTIASPGGRAIVGFSMGGYGAMALGTKHPELFSCAYGMSPGVFAKDGLTDFQPLSNKSAIDGFLTGLENALAQSDKTAAQAKSAKWRSKLDAFTLAYGMAFAPVTQGGIPFMKFPYYRDDRGNLIKDEHAWNAWDMGFGAWDGKTDTYRASLLALRLFAFDAGNNDEYAWIPDGCNYLDELLTTKGIPHFYETYDGRHGDKVAQRMGEIVVPLLAKHLDKATKK